MLGRLILLFLLTPAVELALLIQVDRLIGFWATIALIVVTGIVGSHLARREGLSTWRRLNRRLQAGDLPGKELADGIIILVAGALLITPGILTDVIGFSGLIPFTRTRLRNVLMRWFQRKVDQGTMQVQFGMFGGAAASDSRGTDSEGTNVPPRSPGGHRRSTTDDTWEGRPQDRPNHADEPQGDGDGTAPSSP